MKKNKYIDILTLSFITSFLIGCSADFLDRQPLDQLVGSNFYQSDEQVLAGSAPLYNIVWFQYNDKASHGLGDGRGGMITSGSYQVENVEFRTTAATAEVSTSWRSFFNVIGQANTLIENINAFAGEDVSPAIKNHAIAEARFMRGVAYSFLTQNFGAVPIITKNSSTLLDTTIARNTEESVWEFICRDIRFGIDNLPAAPVKTGRLTKWAAEGMLAKMYLIRAGVGMSPGARNQMYLDSAAYLAKDVIENSGASLVSDFEELFKTKNNNNSETLFALQWTYNGNWGSQNSVQAFLAYSSSITGFPDGWGGDLSGTFHVLRRYAGIDEIDADIPDFTIKADGDKRRKATYMLPADYYSYISQGLLDENGNPFTQKLRVPVGSNGYNDRASIKKYVVGRPEDNEGKVQQQRTEIQTYMLRLADIYLVYAEAVLGNNASTTDGLALAKFNELRVRANVPTKLSLTWEDIFNERILEFAMEGQVWYDFIRLHYYNPQLAYDLLNQQDRGFIRITPDKLVDPTEWTITRNPDDDSRYVTVTSANFRLPMPESEVAKAPNLRKTPVPYDFNESL